MSTSHIIALSDQFHYYHEPNGCYTNVTQPDRSHRYPRVQAGFGHVGQT